MVGRAARAAGAPRGSGPPAGATASSADLGIASPGVASFAGDFEDPAEEGFGAPLPPEDRLWRHPSELGATRAVDLDPAAVRRRWLSSPPSKASAWTAGVVGALLATGLVALGTHLASALTAHPGVAAPARAAVGVTISTAAGDAVGAGLAASIQRTGQSVAAVDVMRPNGVDEHCLGVVVRSDGMILAPAAYVTGASTVLVTLSDAVPYVATLVASDPRSGLAVLHVNGVQGLPVPELGSSQALTGDAFTLAVTSPGGGTFSLGTLTSMDTRMTVHGLGLADVVATDVPVAKAPPGSPLIDASGALVGVVAGNHRGDAVAIPSWVVAPVVDQLVTSGVVHHGWLGITGKSLSRSGFQPAGMLVTRVVPGSAAGIAGLRAGDIVTSVDFQPVGSVVGLLGHLYGLAAGEQVLIGVDRGTTDLFYRAILQGRPGVGATS